MVIDGVLAEELGVEHLVLGAADRTKDGARAELAGQRHVLLAEDLLHESLLVVRVVDDEPAADPDRLPVAPEDPGTERVERAGLDVAARLADERDDAFAQLPGGAVCERHREDLPRPDAADTDEIGDAMGQDTGLARSRAGEDQERAVRRGHGPGLLRVQGSDDLLGAAGCTGCPGRRLLRFARPALVRAELRRLLSGEWRVVQPIGLDEGGRGHLGGIRKGRSGGLRGGVGSVVDGSPTGGGAHRLIVGRAPSPGIERAPLGLSGAAETATARSGRPAGRRR